MSFTILRLVSGVKGEGLKIKVFPASIAGASFDIARISGKFLIHS
jgi:hypothetical protein